MRVAVVGTGHVGLVTCASLAAVGHDVLGCDIDEEKVAALGEGKSPFYEPGLEELLRDGRASGGLRFTSDLTEAARGAEVIFISVGTPPRSNGEANLLAVERVAKSIAPFLQPGAVVVEKSTVPAGTAGRVRLTIELTRPDLRGRVAVVSNPEFLREGQAVEDAMKPARILVGADSEMGLEAMRRLYKPFLLHGTHWIETDITTAELAKHACNAFLAMKISYANALARICELADADVRAVAEVMGTDARIGGAFLEAGLGYGGYCFPKDLAAFQRLSERLGYRFSLLREVAHVNAEAVEAALAKVRESVWNLEEKRIALFGLAFKPGTDDVRLSPAIALAARLLEEGASVVGYDPHAAMNATKELPELEIAESPYEAAAGADAVVVCTGWDEFKTLDLLRLKEAMAAPVIVDGRNVLEPSEITRNGFVYYPTGAAPRYPEDVGISSARAEHGIPA
jgi:UDPglucose 6-dehydrogenase